MKILHICRRFHPLVGGIENYVLEVTSRQQARGAQCRVLTLDYDLLDRSWILVNTAKREGLPLTFIEAAGRGCAILSRMDPDGFSGHFGQTVIGDGWSDGLAALLSEEIWREKGRWGFEYVKANYSAGKALQDHIRLYESCLSAVRR